MTPEIKDMKTWEEAELWLSKHGWGPELILQQKELWMAAQTKAEPVAQPMSEPVAQPKIISKTTKKSTKKGK